jgi:CubicO group peptidase (beta-lactamase class C family)
MGERLLKKYALRIFLLIFLGFCFLFFLNLDMLCQTKAEKIDKFVKLCQEKNIFTGAVMVVENGKIIYQKGIGYANRQWKIPNTPDTKFMLGSVSKQFTSMAVMRLVESKKLKLEAAVSDYLPFYPKENGSKITIHHLLCHSSGLPDLPKVIKDFFSDFWVKSHSTEEYIKKFCDINLQFEPGSKFQYNSAGYYILASIIEEVTGKKFDMAIKELVFDPLGMKDSGSYDHYSILPKKASGYENWDSRIYNTGFADPSIFKGTGSIYSTVEDLYKWDRALSTEKLLSKSGREILFKSHMPLRNGMSYAYGWVVGKRYIPIAGKSVYLTEHTGTFPGFYSVITRLPHDNSVVILLNNICDGKVDHMSKQIVNILYGGDYSLDF